MDSGSFQGGSPSRTVVPPYSTHRRWLPAALLGLGAVLILAWGSWGPAWRAWPALVPLAAALALAWRQDLPAVRRGRFGGVTPAAWLTLAMLAFLMTGAAGDIWFAINGWSPFTMSPRSGLVRMAVLASGLAVLFRFAPRSFPWVLAAALAASVGGSFRELLKTTGGLPVYQFDHPAFMHRLWGLSQALPSLTYYDPTWNAGRVSPYSIASGLPPVAWILGPLWRAGMGIEAHTPVLGAIHIVLVPALCAWAARLCGTRRSGVLAAALLGLGASQFQFLWAIHFGTMGAAFCMPFLVVASAALYAILWRDDTRPRVLASLVVASAVYLSWPGSWIMGLCIVPAVAVSLPRLRGRKLAWLAGAGVAIALLILPLVLATFQHADPTGFASMEKHRFEAARDLVGGWNKLRGAMRSVHPLAVFLGAAGMVLLPARGARRFFPALCLLLAILSGWGQFWKPQFQLTRAIVPLAFVLVLPCAMWVDRLARARRPLFARAIVAAVLVLGGHSVTRSYANHGPAPYRGMGPETLNITAWLKANTDPGSRVLFAGPTVHGYGYAQASLLPVLAEREMIACDYYNFSPRRVEYEMPPKAFRRSPERIRAYLDLHGVGHVITYHPHWIRFFSRTTNDYERVFTFGPTTNKCIFRVLNPAPFLAAGSGRVTAGIDRIDVVPDGNPEEMILRYTWAEGLRVEPPAEIRPVDMGDNIRFIGLKPHGAAACTIRYEGG